MGKPPFRIIDQGNPPAALVGRGVDGKFRRIEAQTPDELKAEARERGVMIHDVAKLHQAPDTEVGSENVANEVGDYAEFEPALPWPPPRSNDADKPPFKNLR